MSVIKMGRERKQFPFSFFLSIKNIGKTLFTEVININRKFHYLRFFYNYLVVIYPQETVDTERGVNQYQVQF
jgi:hypothetical protein